MYWWCAIITRGKVQLPLTFLKLNNQIINNNPKKRPTYTTSSSTQTETPPEVANIPEVSNNSSPSRNQKWHYVIVNNLPAGFTTNHIVHHVKEKLGFTEFIRCFPLINSSSESKTSTFKIGFLTKVSASKLFNNDVWPPGVSVKWSNESSLCQEASPRPTMDSLQPVKINQVIRHVSKSSDPSYPVVAITSDKHAIAVCKSNSFSCEKSFQFTKDSHNVTNFSLDPMTPPTVRLTQESSTGGNRYIMSRLREPAILSSLKLFLAYLHDQPSSVCFEGYTSTSVKVFLASEGLPVDPIALRAIYYKFHDFYGISSVEVDEDLSTYRTYITSERRIHLQKIRECNSRYFTADSSKKNF